MNVEMEFEARANYLFVRARGPSDPESVRKALMMIRDKALETGLTRLLVDARGVGAPVREFDRYLMGEAMAELLRAPFKVAFLYRAESINKFAENTAVNRGANVLIVAEEAQALDWLLRGVPA